MRRNHRAAPRTMPVYPSEEVVIELPPTIPTRSNQPTWIMILQIFGMLGGMSGAIAYTFINKNNANNPLWWVPLLSGLMMMASIGSIFQNLLEPRRFKRNLAQREKDYRAYLADQLVFIDTLAETQRREYENVHPSIDECLAICADAQTRQPSPRMWERWRSNDGVKDFLHCRVGVGRIPATYRVRPAQNPSRSLTADVLVQELLNLVNAAKTVPSAAVTVPLPNIGVLGITGDGSENVLRAIVVHMVTHHSPADVKLSLAMNSNQLAHWTWVRWLPHIWNDNQTRRMIATTHDDVSTQIEQLVSLIQQRSEQMREKSGNAEFMGIAHVACFIDIEAFVQREDIFRKFMYVLNNGAMVGVYVVIVSKGQLPRECRGIIEIQSINARYKENASSQEVLFVPDQITLAQTERLARAQAPWQSTSVSGDNSVPARVSLMDLLNVESIDQFDFAKKWERNHPWENLYVPIGLGGGRMPVVLDVQKHGPHGLGAGTTGSGKSELLLTLIAMLASQYSPEEVVFLLLDFKGEGMAGRVAQLPHLAGVLSNLSASQTNRVLISLNAELNRRQRIFKEYSINDINDYLEKRRKNQSMPALPMMLIIADEFAQLKDEQPEFIDQLVSVARIGRTLGMRMLLTTQNPSGVVTKQIYSNTSYRFCLKVASRDDSMELIGNPEAAYLPGRGAGFLKIGEGQPIQFQSGYTGDAYVVTEVDAPVINTIGIDGKRTQLVGPRVQVSEETQLEHLVECIKQVAVQRNIVERYQVWAPALPNEPPVLADVAAQFRLSTNWNGAQWTGSQDDVRPLIGLYDDPTNQKQGELYIPISERGHVGIYVAAGENRSLFARTLVGATVLQHNPVDVQFIFLDFGASGLLRAYEQLPHTIAVASLSQNEMITRINTRINEELAMRARVLGGVTFAAYRQSTPRPLPRIVIVIDNVIELRDQSHVRPLQETIDRVAQNGAPLGIHLVVIMNTPNEAGGRIRQQIGFSLGIGVSRDMAYEISNRRGMVIDEQILGRAVASNPACECQIAALASDGEMGQVRYLRSLIHEMSSNTQFTLTHQIREIPERIPMEFIQRMFNREPAPFTMNMAINIDTEQVELFDFNIENPYMLICGGAKSGKSSLIQVITSYFVKQLPSSQIVMMSNGSTQLAPYQHHQQVIAYESATVRWINLVQALEEALSERKVFYDNEIVSTGLVTRTQMLARFAPVVLIVDSDRWNEFEELDSSVRSRLAKLLQAHRDTGLFVFVSADSDKLKATKVTCEFTQLMKSQTVIGLNVKEENDVTLVAPKLYFTGAESVALRQGMRPGRAVIARPGAPRVRVQFVVPD
jgi:S-DNA-T family DNA segregation ATPase FtsK/SpoIIIE